MSEDAVRFLCVAALLAQACSGRAAWACHRARRGYGDARQCGKLGGVFLLPLSEAGSGPGLIAGAGWWLRTLAKQHDLYANRRPFRSSRRSPLRDCGRPLCTECSGCGTIKRYRAIWIAALISGFWHHSLHLSARVDMEALCRGLLGCRTDSAAGHQLSLSPTSSTGEIRALLHANSPRNRFGVGTTDDASNLRQYHHLRIDGALQLFLTYSWTRVSDTNSVNDHSWPSR